MTLHITRLTTTADDFDARLADLLAWDTREDADVVAIVRDIIDAVRTQGDEAVLRLTAELDGVQCASVAELELTPADFQRAYQAIPGAERDALTHAAQRIRDYHERQRAADWSFEDALGNRLGQRITPLARVGLYVPGGQATYPSTALMTAIPAKVAGVPEVIMTTPIPAGEASPLLLAAAHVAGIDKAFTIGGAQAVAALAYGTASIPRVDKIVGPGGAFVAAAKRLVFGQVGIDLIAGPSEVLVIADGSTPVEWVVMDLFSQAEHDAVAQALLVTPDAAYLDAVAQTMQRLLPARLRKAVISQSLHDRGALILTRNLEEAFVVANRIAPEHLELAIADPADYLPLVQNAGAIFLGPHSGEVMGDYVAGPSHVLPTYGTARFSSPLGVYDFEKRSSVIELSARGVQPLAQTAATLAHGEGFEAHARAAELRLKDIDHNI